MSAYKSTNIALLERSGYIYSFQSFYYASATTGYMLVQKINDTVNVAYDNICDSSLTYIWSTSSYSGGINGDQSYLWQSTSWLTSNAGNVTYLSQFYTNPMFTKIYPFT